MSLSRRAFALAGLAGVAACSRPDAANAPLKAADVHPADYPTVTAVGWIGEELERLTEGRVRIRQYPSGQLGSEDDSIGLTRFEAIDICRVSVAALNNAFPQTVLLSLPYVYRSAEHIRSVIDGRGLIGLAYYDAGPRNLYNVRKPVTEPGQLQGLKIRAPQSDVFLDTLRAMGANPTPLGFSATFSSLQTHLIDGAENNWPSYQSSRQFEVARYLSITEHSYLPDALLISRASLNRLEARDRELVIDVAQRSVPIMRAAWETRQAEARKAVLAAGAQAVEVDREAFAAATRPVLGKYLGSPELRALYDRIAATA
jgi:tripartite ATP-independent transporter DctP family solute receptor